MGYSGISCLLCGYGPLRDSLIRDQIVFGVHDRTLRDRLLREEDLTLDKATQICQAAELVKHQLSMWDGGSQSTAVSADMSVLEVARSVPRNSVVRKYPASKPETPFRCKFCNNSHVRGACPAFGKTCSNCGKANHFAVMCWRKNSKATVHEVLQDSVDADTFFVNVVHSSASEIARNTWLVPVTLGNACVNFKIDTGAQVDILPSGLFVALEGMPKLVKSKLCLRAYGGSQLDVLGEVKLPVIVNGRRIETVLLVVEGGAVPILGLKTCEALGIVRRVFEVVQCPALSEVALRREILDKFPNLFKGTGCLKTSYKIRLHDDAVPVIEAPRRIPSALRDRLQMELDQLVKEGIIKRIEEPTDWVSSLVIVEKKNSKRLRLCLDPKNLNAFVKREHFQIPTREELESDLAGAKFFSQLDATSGFYQIPLDEDSAKLCTFNTPFGRFCFMRLPFGISSAPEVFHREFSRVFAGIEGVSVYFDNMLVRGETRDQHDRRLLEALQRAEQAGVTLNAEKCVFAVTEIEFLGDRLTSGGIYPDPTKVRAISDMSAPSTKQEVQRVLGMLTYVAKFLPNLSDCTIALRSLLKKNVSFQWGHEHEREWEHLKLLLTKHPVLQFYDGSLPTSLAVDASGTGLGAVLLQKHPLGWMPVAYASRCLTAAERNYATIEKETLALLFGCERFHSFVYGRPFVLFTDHKPLVSINRKNLSDMPPRLQRFFLRLLRYQFSLEYIPGKDMAVADTLSRASYAVPSCVPLPDEDIEIHVDFVMSSQPFSERIKLKLVRETASDPILQAVSLGLRGKGDIPRPYCTFREELSVAQGLLLKGTRIIIPSSCRPDLLGAIHEGHLGIEKCRRRARQHVYWPGMNADISQLVQSCAPCNVLQYAQRSEPAIERQYPNVPWDVLGCDLFQVGRDYFLLVVDAFSNYPEVEQITDSSASTVIPCLKRIFARHGIPRVVFSDNGPPFSSKLFHAFAVEYQFEHQTSSPYFPQSNGLAEKGVQIVKRLLKKALASGGDWEIGLLNYRSSPLGNGLSPAELLMGRRLRTKLPQVDISSGPPVQKPGRRANCSALPPLQGGEMVRVRVGGCWPIKATVVDKVAPRSYWVRTEEGSDIRRNRLHLRKCLETDSPDFRGQTLESGVEPLEGPVSRCVLGERDRVPDLPLSGDDSSQGQSTVVTPSVDQPDILPGLQSHVRRTSRLRKPPVRLDL